MSSVRLTRLKFISAIIFIMVIYNEWISYMLKTYSWQKLTLEGEEAVKILIIADPQILSIQSEPNFPFNYVAVWDANRFVSRTFQMALSFSEPDIIVFLGDLINDGSLSEDEYFSELVTAFKDLFYIPATVKYVFYIPGDNDIGGEGYDSVSINKIQRFNQAFNVSDHIHYKFVSLYHLNVIPGADSSSLPSLTPELRTKIRLLFSHLPLIPGARKSTIEQINALNPSAIFSAHDHDSYKFVGKKGIPKAEQFWLLREEGKIWEMDLQGEDLHEISVPTCSYRMGKEKYGFGYSVVTPNGELKYTILWLPSRFSHLWCYFWGLCLCISMLVYPFFVHMSERFNQVKSSSLTQKFHRV